jgi:DNA-binding NtrC family response regulator
VRELRNAVSRGFILATDTIQPEDLPGNIVTGGEADGDCLRFRPGSKLKEVERRMILATLEYFESDKTKTAEALGVSVKTLYNRLQAYEKGPST